MSVKRSAKQLRTLYGPRPLLAPYWMRTTTLPRLRRHIAVVEVGIIVAIDLTTGVQARRPLIVTALIHIDTQTGIAKGRDL